MFLLILFSFLAGIVTILSPCILPILPIVLSGSLTGGKKRPIGIILGFIASFTFFTLFLTAIVKSTGLSADFLRNLSVVIVATFGLSLLYPKFQVRMEQFFSKFAGLVPINQSNPDTANHRPDLIAGLLIGLSLGLVWTPCVGPILASIITIAVTSTVTTDAFIITLAYAIGTSMPLLAITYSGRTLLQKVPWLLASSGKIQKAFGVLMIIAGISIYLQLDRKFQTFILDKFPNYGVGLTKFEDNSAVKKQLDVLRAPQKPQKNVLNKLLAPDLGPAPELISGGRWFNPSTSSGQALTIKSLHGKVVLVDFWTYTCINCIRTLPYLKSWHAKYKDKGLVIIGVHTPEFEFEKNPDNVAKAIKDFGLEYAVMQDNNYATWNAYNNRYWPAKYLIDKDGRIRYTHFGEGNYDETEKKIQELLEESGSLVGDVSISNPTYQVQTRTPETYLGFRRMSGLASPERVKVDEGTLYTTPTNLNRNSFALSGQWMIGDEYASPAQGSSLTYRFDAKEVFLVMRPKTEGLTGRIRVTLDNQSLTINVAGEDTKEGIVTIDSDRLYKLIKLSTPGEHTLKLEFLDGTIDLYAFTFG
ncbi:cytochrome c biogenesis protein DipZ [Candidatus Gottesmanbacteria bacterium]|nr:cytochrome c biogenesis protein DipZ [Candidatus Gottesmanbacteria bacterium]